METTFVPNWNQYLRGEKFEVCHQSLDEKEIQKSLEDYLTNIRLNMRKIKLRNCHIDDQILKMLSGVLKKEMSEIDLSANFDLPSSITAELFRNTRPKNVNLSECVIAAEDDDLMDVLFGSNVEYLDLSHHGFSAKETARCLERFAESSEPKTLKMVDCGVTSNVLLKVAVEIKSSRGIHLRGKVIDLSCNDVGLEGMKSLGQILSFEPPSEIESLELRGCDLDAKKLEAFQRETNAKITKLDVSDNPIQDKGCKSIAQLVQKVNCKDLAIRNCEIECVKELSEAEGVSEVRRLDVSENLYIDAESVGQIARAWKVEELILKNCMYEAEDLHRLSEGLANHKLKLLDIREPAANPSDDKREAVLQLSKAHKKVFF